MLNMQGKNFKTNEKLTTAASGVSGGDHQEKGFSLLTTDSIQLWAWLDGYQPLDEQSLKSLSEDISYKNRETTDVSLGLFLHLSKKKQSKLELIFVYKKSAVNYMHHCKRSYLKTSDLNQTFYMSNIEVNFQQICDRKIVACC